LNILIEIIKKETSSEGYKKLLREQKELNSSEAEYAGKQPGI